jgi:hypothetical protein
MSTGNIDWKQKCHDAVKKYKRELAVVRKSLANSHNACAMLRTRLEEMADFLDHLFAMEEQGWFLLLAWTMDTRMKTFLKLSSFNSTQK